jgi:probable addiction module antidote protein
MTRLNIWTALKPSMPIWKKETDDPAFIAKALGTIARARGMAQIARKAGLSRESLYKALSTEGNPEFGTVIRVMQALGLKFSITATNSH